MKKLLLILLITFVQNAIAATATTTLAVSATVVNSCSITVGNLLFGNYSTADVTGQSTITLTCTNGATYTIAADKGVNGTLAQRIMKSGTNSLNYNLYTDSARTIIWGDGTSSTVTIAGTGTGTSQTINVYGKIPAGQNTVKAGSYTDTVNVTISY